MFLNTLFFRTVNYSLMAGIVVFTIIVIVGQSNASSADQWSFLPPVFAGLLVMFLNSVCTQVWFEKYYPDNFPSLRFRFWSMLFLVINVIILLGSVFILYFGAKDLFFNAVERMRDPSTWEYILFYIILFFTIAGLYITIVQTILRRKTRINQIRKFSSFLESGPD
jgi:ABC-type uncharacterized transport system fused permease/ATPase subunit